MASMEEQFETACNDGTIPGAVLLASNRNSTLVTLLSYRLEVRETQIPFTMPAHLVSALFTPTSRWNWTV